MSGLSSLTANQIDLQITSYPGQGLFSGTVYISLYTVMPSAGGGGVEVSGGSYARAAAPYSSWSNPSNGSISNSAVISFPTATGSWGNVVGFGLCDNVAPGTGLEGFAPFVSPIAIASGQAPKFNVGQLTVSLSGNISTFQATQYLGIFKGNNASGSTFIALFTNAPSAGGGGVEVSGGSYARVNLGSGPWAVPASGFITNKNAIVFPSATGSWGNVVAWGIFDASSAGNLLSFGVLTSALTVGSGQAPRFNVGQLSYTAT